MYGEKSKKSKQMDHVGIFIDEFSISPVHHDYFHKKNIFLPTDGTIAQRLFPRSLYWFAEFKFQPKPFALT